MRVAPDRLVPVIVVQAPCEIPGRKLAPFTTLVTTVPVNAPTGKMADWLLTPPMERIIGRCPAGCVPGVCGLFSPSAASALRNAAPGKPAPAAAVAVLVHSAAGADRTVH